MNDLIMNIGKKYYQFCIQLFVSIIKTHPAIDSIVLNGSLNNDNVVYFKSDIDISIILKEKANRDIFIKFYKKRCRIFSLICPFILPIEERVQNVYTTTQLMASTPHLYNGYLEYGPYKVLWGKSLQYSKNEFNQYVFLENKIQQLIQTKNNNARKTKELSEEMNIESTKFDRSLLENMCFFRTYENLLLNLPYIDNDIHNTVIHYSSSKELLSGASEFYSKHPLVNSVHYCAPWIVYIDIQIKVIHENRINELFEKKHQAYSENNKYYYQQDISYLTRIYLQNFIKYKPTPANDMLTRPTLINLANIFKFHNENQIGSIATLDQAINYILFEKEQLLQDKISLCICTKNRKNSLLELFESIQKQQVHPSEIVLINNGDKWDIEFENKLKQNLSKIEFNIYNSDLPTISSLRNFAISKAKNEIISFVDDDCYLTNSWIKQVSFHFNSDPELTVLGGTVYHARQKNDKYVELFSRSFLEESC